MSANESASPWDALGDPTRRQIFERVVARPRSVAEVAEGLPISRPAVSQHLRVLKDAGLVAVRVEGTRHVYTLHTAGIAHLRRDLDRFWDHALAAFQAAVEQDEKNEHPAPKKGRTPS